VREHDLTVSRAVVRSVRVVGIARLEAVRRQSRDGPRFAVGNDADETDGPRVAAVGRLESRRLDEHWRRVLDAVVRADRPGPFVRRSESGPSTPSTDESVLPSVGVIRTSASSLLVAPPSASASSARCPSRRAGTRSSERRHRRSTRSGPPSFPSPAGATSRASLRRGPTTAFVAASRRPRVTRRSHRTSSTRPSRSVMTRSATDSVVAVS